MLALHLMLNLERFMILLSFIVLCLCLFVAIYSFFAFAIIDFYVDCGSCCFMIRNLNNE